MNIDNMIYDKSIKFEFVGSINEEYGSDSYYKVSTDGNYSLEQMKEFAKWKFIQPSAHPGDTFCSHVKTTQVYDDEFIVIVHYRLDV